MKYPSTERNPERGVYIVLSPILLLLLLSVAALAFDSLNLILARYRLMRAVDNSILSSPMLLIGSRDLTSVQVKEALETKLKAQISLNYPLPDLSFNVEVPDLGTARISARLSRRLFLAPVVFNSNTSSDVFFDSEVIIPRVNAVVAIDCSWSMSRIDSLNPGQLKIGTALAAANYVLEYLRESYDRVSLVIFDQEATVVIPYHRYTTIVGATLRWDVAKGHLSSSGYRSRDSQATTLYKIIDQYHERFEREWEARYQERFGYLRPVVIESFRKYLDCGIYERGCAHAKCPDCNHSMIIAFSCKQRGLKSFVWSKKGGALWGTSQQECTPQGTTPSCGIYDSKAYSSILPS